MADTSINDQDSQSIVYARAAIIDRRTGATLFRVRNITRQALPEWEKDPNLRIQELPDAEANR